MKCNLLLNAHGPLWPVIGKSLFEKKTEFERAIEKEKVEARRGKEERTQSKTWPIDRQVYEGDGDRGRDRREITEG